MAGCGALLAATAVDAELLLTDHRPPHIEAIAWVAPFTTAPLLAFALWQGCQPGRSAKGHVMRCVLLGWANCVLAATLARGWFGEIGSVVAGVCSGWLIGGGLGLLYGLATLPATWTLRRLRERPTLDAAARATATVGATVLVGATFALLTSLAHGRPTVAPALPGALITLATLLAFHGSWWARRIARLGRRDGVERVSLAEVAEASRGALPLHAGVSADPTHALVTIERSGEGAYRHAPTRRVVALVD